MNTRSVYADRLVDSILDTVGPQKLRHQMIPVKDGGKIKASKQNRMARLAKLYFQASK